MCSAGDNAALPALGFPIRASAGQRLFSASPRLIAAVHALHRLLVPRHPPCALTILTVIEPNGSVIPVRDCAFARSRTFVATVQFSRTAGGKRPPCWPPRSASAGVARRAPVSQSSTACRPPGAALKKDATPSSRPARFGRHARPAGRSSDPGWVAGSGGAPLGAP
jgi:hypothetical protein